MRRPLLVAALAAAVPLAVVAAIANAPTGKVVDLDNYNASATASYINADQCAGAPLLNLEWSIVPVSGGTSSGTHRIIASSAAPPTTGDVGVANFCPPDAPNATTPVYSNQVDFVTWTSNIQRKQVSGKLAAETAHVACDATGEGKAVYICAHLEDGSSTRKGYASGKFLVQVAKPDAPTGVTAGAGDTRLYVSWTASGGSVAVDHYVAAATPTAGGTTVFSSAATGEDATIEGLVNGTAYTVVVYAYSLGGNQSVASTPAVEGTPQPVDDFWERYRATPGAREEGGCGAGGTGPLALLSVALLALLRRRS